MGASREELRRAVGRALRRVRQEWRLSLDDVEQASSTLGVRITRSHLSRVENGQADLALPRFLCLMRAVGEPVAEVVESLDVLLDPDPGDLGDPETRAIEMLRRGEPAAAAVLLRQAARRVDGSLPGPVLRDWARAEAALGRWRASARVLRGALGPLGAASPELLLQLAAATLGAGQPGVALPLARAAGGRHAASALVVECCCLLETDLALVGQCLSRLDQSALQVTTTERAMTLIVKSEHCRRSGQTCSAARFARSAAGLAREAVFGVEARLAIARAEGAARRPAAGLRALDQARAQARECGRPDLLALCHREAERLWKLEGDREAARQALRAARAIWRRCAADRHTPRNLPLHGLFHLGVGRPDSDAAPPVDAPIRGR